MVFTRPISIQPTPCCNTTSPQRPSRSPDSSPAPLNLDFFSNASEVTLVPVSMRLGHVKSDAAADAATVIGEGTGVALYVVTFGTKSCTVLRGDDTAVAGGLGAAQLPLDEHDDCESAWRAGQGEKL